MPADWPFTGYEKIAESLEAWLGDDEAAYRASSRAEWIVTEKIHGANFCLVTDGVTIRGAKRKAFLAPDEDFFGHTILLERLAPAVLRLAALARARDATAALVYVYGELFGGGYPHPDVPPDPRAQPVQTGCWYAPGIEFCAFDLATLREGAAARSYLDHDDAARLFEEAGIFHARPLLRGSYEDALAFPLGFDSTLPAALGLPPLPPGNRAEGVVFKPARAIVVPRRAGVVHDGAASGPIPRALTRAIRPIVKRKIAEFAEDARFHGAEKWASRRAAAGALEALEQEASALVNENRLNAAVSKVGRVEAGDAARRAEVAALVVEDLHAELAAHHGDRLRALSAAEAASLARFVEGEARALVDLYLG